MPTTHALADLESAQTLSGPKTLNSPNINSGVVVADPTTAMGVASKQYADNSTFRENALLNPNLNFWNRGTLFFTIADGAYAADMWRYGKSGVGVHAVQKSGVVPAVNEANQYLASAVQIGCTTIDAAIAAGDFYTFSQRIEGYRWRGFAQRALTLSFWVVASKVGTYCVSLRNNASGTPDRCFVAEFTIAAASIWYKKTIAISASPADGTWDYTTGAGIEVSFCFAAGSTFQTTAGGWNTGNFYATANQINALDSISNFMTITGLRLEAGTVVAQIVDRDIAVETAMLERYYQSSFPDGTAPAQNAGITGATRLLNTTTGAAAYRSPTIPFRSRMRLGGVTTIFNTDAANAQIRNVTDSADFTSSVVSETNDTGFIMTGTGNAGAAVSEILAVHWACASNL